MPVPIETLMLFLLPTAGVTLLWLFFGLYQEREYGTHHLFLKHRPTWKFYFAAPEPLERGESWNDRTASDRRKEHLYRQFIEERGGSFRSIYIGF